MRYFIIWARSEHLNHYGPNQHFQSFIFYFIANSQISQPRSQRSPFNLQNAGKHVETFSLGAMQTVLLKPGSKKEKSCREFKLALVWTVLTTLVDSCPLYPNLNLLKFFLRIINSFLAFCPGWWELNKTLVRANSQQLSFLSGPMALAMA